MALTADGDKGVGHSFGLRDRRRRDQEHHRDQRAQDGAGRHRAEGEQRDGKYVIKKLPGRLEGRRHHPEPRPHGGQQLRQVDQGLPVRKDGRRPQGRGDHRLRLRGERRSSGTSSPTPGPRAWRSAPLQGRRHRGAAARSSSSPVSGSRSSDAPLGTGGRAGRAPGHVRRQQASAEEARQRDALVTEFPFVLPRGYVDPPARSTATG